MSRVSFSVSVCQVLSWMADFNSDWLIDFDRLQIFESRVCFCICVYALSLCLCLVCQVLFRMADVNFDGLIDFDEFQGMVYFLVTQHLTSSGKSWMLDPTVQNETLSMKSFQPEVEPMVDALLYEPIPYRSAIEQGCTHVLVLRSYPDGRRMPQGYLGLFERLVAPKCLDPFPKVKKYMISLKHSERYSEDILRLNEGVAPALAAPNEVDDAMQTDDAREVGRLLALDCAGWMGLFEDSQVGVGSGLGSAGPHLLAVAPFDIGVELAFTFVNVCWRCCMVYGS